jgi:orotate phosphoribosyltransferase
MEAYKKRFAEILAETGALFFAESLKLKDGRPTPYFVNLGKFRTGRLNYELGSFFADMMEAGEITNRIDVIVGPSYKGSSIANATANALWLKYGKDILFDYDRKEEKTHGESSGRKNLFVNGCLDTNARIYIVDDVGTSMATKYELLEKINDQALMAGSKIEIVGVGLAVDREQSSAVYDEHGCLVLNRKGHDAIGEFQERTGIPVMRICRIREIVEYLFREGIPVLANGCYAPLNDATMAVFHTYLEMYGIAGKEH